MARRRVYLHPVRWTSLGLSLIEAMHLGMPVAGLAAREHALARYGLGRFLAGE
jgi:glycosyltransferase involved in cell wall biosynthesis